MNKAVMISIQSYYVFLIIARLMGWNIPQDKKVEVRKDFPKDKDWNKKVNIYCSKNKKSFNRIPKEYQPLMRPFLGKVIGEFVCDYVEEIACEDLGYEHIYYTENGDCINDKAQLSNAEIKAYLGICCNGNILGYAWGISQLKIYDKPKELSEFSIMKKCNACKSGYESSACIYDNDCKVLVPLTRPFQSWGYICSNE